MHPFARHYTHTGMIGLDGAKMSKSRGNLVFVSKLRAQDVDPNAIRLALLAGHYRSDREWTDELLTAAQERLARWRAAVALRGRPARRRPRPAPAHPPRRRPRLARRARRRRRVGRARRSSAAAPTRTAPALVRAAVDALLGVAL